MLYVNSLYWKTIQPRERNPFTGYIDIYCWAYAYPLRCCDIRVARNALKSLGELLEPVYSSWSNGGYQRSTWFTRKPNHRPSNQIKYPKELSFVLIKSATQSKTQLNKNNSYNQIPKAYNPCFCNQHVFLSSWTTSHFHHSTIRRTFSLSLLCYNAIEVGSRNLDAEYSTHTVMHKLV